MEHLKSLFTKTCFALFFMINWASTHGQSEFNYKFHLVPKQISGLDGLHSYAFGQLDGKWVLIGGRLDGLHARQPFNAFPASHNNKTIYVVDPERQQVWTSDFQNLSLSIQEQLQSTNLQFYQDGEKLILIGGYGFSPTEGDHITYPYLTSIDLAGLINAVINEEEIIANFEQIIDENFAVTGGNLGKIGEEFLLVGGHRFDGRYNPMNHPTFTQTYTNQIRKFSLNYSPELGYTEYSTITDEVHLRRRDYNLVPQIFPDGSFGYTLFSGVFQINQDLPFLYPVDIDADQYIPRENFNQLLSNYHSARVALYDSTNSLMYTVFFGGISQYYYENGNLVQDNNVPFVKTISLVSRSTDGTLSEVALPQEMPAYLGSSAEFIIKESSNQIAKDIILVDESNIDTLHIGYIFGGIESPELNPFSFNNTEVTFASNTIFEVYLVPNETTSILENELSGYHDFKFTPFPNPTNDSTIFIKINLEEMGGIDILLSDVEGKILSVGFIENVPPGENVLEFQLPEKADGLHILTLISNGKYFASKKVMLSN